MRFRIRRSRGGKWRLAVASIVVAGVAVAASTAFAGRLLSSSNDPVDQAVAGQAKELVAYRASWGEFVSAWSAPTADGRQCGFFQIDSTLSSAAVFHPNNGGFCRLDSGAVTFRPGQNPFATTTEWMARADGEYSPLIEGAAIDGSGITRVAIDGPGGFVGTAASKDGYFVAELPETSTRDIPAGDEYDIVGFDAGGSVVARVNINELITQGTP